MFGGILVSAVIIFLLYYTMLPAINLKSQDFIIFLILSTLIILTVNFITYKMCIRDRSKPLVSDPILKIL